MKVSYDSNYDLLYIKFGKARRVLSKPVSEDITLDMDAQGKLVGIEILSATEHINLANLFPVEIEKKLAVK
jgi:uncharacterized protein YuzE